MSNLKSKRFVVRKSLIGKNQIIEVTFKSGKTFTYNHDIVYELMKSKLNEMNCFNKYKSYTSSTSIPVILRDKVVI
jgi:hypothetical protein